MSHPQIEDCPQIEQCAAGELWLIKKAMNGMKTASKDFGDPWWQT